MGCFGRLTYSVFETAEMLDQAVVIGGCGFGIAALFGAGAPTVGAALAGSGTGVVGITATTASDALSNGRCFHVNIRRSRIGGCGLSKLRTPIRAPRSRVVHLFPADEGAPPTGAQALLVRWGLIDKL